MTYLPYYFFTECVILFVRHATFKILFIPGVLNLQVIFKQFFLSSCMVFVRNRCVSVFVSIHVCTSKHVWMSVCERERDVCGKVKMPPHLCHMILNYFIMKIIIFLLMFFTFHPSSIFEEIKVRKWEGKWGTKEKRERGTFSCLYEAIQFCFHTICP